MTSRERVAKTLNFEEPDRVPIDIGGSRVTGIMAQAYSSLRKHAGLPAEPPRVYDLMQMLADVDEDYLDLFGIDVVGLEQPKPTFDIAARDYKPWTLPDGTPVLMPGQFNPTQDAAGNWLLSPGGQADAPPAWEMPKDGYYFDAIGSITIPQDLDALMVDPADYASQLPIFTDEELSDIRERGRQLYENTDYAILGGFWRGSLWAHGMLEWPMLLTLDPAWCKEMVAAMADVAIENLKLYSEAVGEYCAAILIQGNDFGTQRGELFRPELFYDVMVPGWQRINGWVHENTSMKTFTHTCGANYDIIEGWIQAGFDILNPVQCSADGMEAERLKQDFGGRITFWGGGVDTQQTLPFGTPDDVRREVAERVNTFAPGGGFVFNAIHNVQHGTPPENLAAMLETAREVGAY
ncbi:MAG TPA: uroporphyrinogen decarboxylase family protein [Armatimonadota bacterium]|nr:uroporphyrinogen decarboxylase family protein [Armatimonadota bacterium]